jgi:2,4-dienoyl-CoA reductase-like NADH-dependent reductase (Old Yellow Enzyme family)
MSQYRQPYEELYPHLFSTYTIGKTTFKNRIFSPPHGHTHIVTPEGFLNNAGIAFYGNIARGGAAVVTLCEARIDKENGLAHDSQIDMTEEKTIRTLNHFTDYARVYGAEPSMELTHCGQWSLPQYNGGRNPIGPSAKIMPNGNVVDEMTEEDMDRIADKFAEAAIMSKRGGFNMALVHGGHSWLLMQFISPLENQRKDKYGGSLENRARFPMMVLDRIRAAVGKDFIIEYRISTTELTPGGLEIDEACEFIKMIEDKIDIVQCSVGMRRNAVTRAIMHPSHFVPHGGNVYLAEAMKKSGVKIPVTAIGAITDPKLADQIIAEGRADFVAICRGFLADIDWAEKARAGRADDIRPCIKCLRCLDINAGRLNTSTKVVLQDFKSATRRNECSVNPIFGREHLMHNFPAAKRVKKVVVVGGGLRVCRLPF